MLLPIRIVIILIIFLLTGSLLSAQTADSLQVVPDTLQITVSPDSIPSEFLLYSLQKKVETFGLPDGIVSVMDRGELDKNQCFSLAEIIQKVSGNAVAVLSRNRIDYPQEILSGMVRNVDLVVLINGLTVKNDYLDLTFFETIPLSIVERIEFLPAEWNIITHENKHVLNIITYRDIQEQTTSWAGFRQGTNQLDSYQLNVSGLLGKAWSGQFSYDAYRLNALDPEMKDNSENDFFGMFIRQISKNWQIQIQGRSETRIHDYSGDYWEESWSGVHHAYQGEVGLSLIHPRLFTSLYYQHHTNRLESSNTENDRLDVQAWKFYSEFILWKSAPACLGLNARLTFIDAKQTPDQNGDSFWRNQIGLSGSLIKNKRVYFFGNLACYFDVVEETISDVFFNQKINYSSDPSVLSPTTETRVKDTFGGQLGIAFQVNPHVAINIDYRSNPIIAWGYENEARYDQIGVSLIKNVKNKLSPQLKIYQQIFYNDHRWRNVTSKHEGVFLSYPDWQIRDVMLTNVFEYLFNKSKQASVAAGQKQYDFSWRYENKVNYFTRFFEQTLLVDLFVENQVFHLANDDSEKVFWVMDGQLTLTVNTFSAYFRLNNVFDETYYYWFNQQDQINSVMPGRNYYLGFSWRFFD